MTPKELIFAHRYSEAAKAYQTLQLQHPEKNYHDALGEALLCLGRFSEAASSFKKALEIESGRVKEYLPYLNQIGAALWLSGNKSGAMVEWHKAVSGILDGSSAYGDLAGGATQGLLLWYGAVTLHDPQEREYALKYFQHLKRKKTYGRVLWPRPVFEMVLGEKSFAEILAEGIGSPDLGACIQMARSDLLKRRELCQALFYGACYEREAGNETECMSKMRACFQLENPIIEVEWYLARNECGANSASAGS